MWPIMVGNREEPSPQNVSLHITGVAKWMNRRTISLPGRNSRVKRRGNRLSRAVHTMEMAQDSTRASRVARAAPSTPSRGAPRLPKMNTQLRKVLLTMDTPRIASPRLGLPMARWAPMYTCTKLSKK